MPYIWENSSSLLAAIEDWKAVGNPCHRSSFSFFESRKSSVDLVLYSNKALKLKDHLLVTDVRQALGPHQACFSRIQLVCANLTTAEDIYPAGPSNMFFKVFLDPAVSSHFAHSTHIFWMEYDVFPVRPGWLHVLLSRASQHDFWMMGSMYLGTGLDSAAASSYNWNWVGHINGNALYNLQDPVFRDFLRVVVQYEPPNHFWKPFDVSMWRVLHAFPYTWPLHQRFRTKFLLADFIHHWGFHITEADVAFSMRSQAVHLIHGARYSAGNLLIRPKDPTPDVVWHDQIPASLRLSVMIRSFVGDMDYAAEALRSAVKFIPNALEIVVVVPLADVGDFFSADLLGSCCCVICSALVPAIIVAGAAWWRRRGVVTVTAPRARAAAFEKTVHDVPGARIIGEPTVTRTAPAGRRRRSRMSAPVCS